MNLNTLTSISRILNACLKPLPILMTWLALSVAASGAGLVFELDFESDTAGGQPGGGWTISPSSNNSTNGAVVVDATTTPVNPLPGKSLYVYDLNGDLVSGVGTHMRGPISEGAHISAARISLNFQRMYAVEEVDTDTRVHFTLGPVDYSLNNSDFRLFEVRLLNNGSVVVEYSTDETGDTRGSVTAGTYDVDNPNELVIFINSHSTETKAYDDGLLAGSLAPNMMDVYLNGVSVGSYLTLKTPDTVNAPLINFWASDADLGQLALYQDSKRQGGIVFDNIRVEELVPLDQLPVYLDTLDFESDTLGEKPVIPFTTAFSPTNNTTTNGFVVVDATTTPASPMDTGKALYAYDLSNGASTHMRFNFEPENTDNVRVDFDFQRMYEVDLLDENARIHIALAPSGLETNNSDFRPFEIRLQNNGTIVVNYNPTGAELDGRESIVAATYETTGANHITFLANGNNAASLPYDDEVLGQGEVGPNSMVLWLNGVLLGEYGFINTPDPVFAPQIKFFETTKDFGRLGIYQDTSRQGGIVFDNLSIRAFAALPPPAAPSDLIATATGSTTISLSWTDNSSDETGFVIEQKDGSNWTETGTVAADVISADVASLEPATTYTFRVRSTNGTPSAPSNEATATTDEQLTPRVIEQPQGGSVPVGSTYTLSVTAGGLGNLSYQWYTGASGDTSNLIEGAVEASYTTPALDVTTSYWVRITNDSGYADSDAATVDVFQPRTIRVVSLVQLHALLPDALPGDTYVMDNGTYPNSAIIFEAEGTETAPITLKAQTPGQVVLTGNSHIEIGGNWLVVEGLLFTNGWNQTKDTVINYRTSNKQANNCRVTQCAIIDYSPATPATDRDWIGIWGVNNRFDHNLVSGHSTIGVTLVVWRNPGKEDFHRIDHNHFRNRGNGGGENGWETIRIGTSGDSLSDSSCIVEYNLFETCDGEIEIISNKSGNNTYRYNTFWKSQGMLTMRHGNHCLIEGNIFLGDGVANTGGIRVIGEDHVIINNYIERTMGREGAAIAVYAGVPDSPLNEYYAAHNAWVAHNTIVDVAGAHVRVGAGYPTSNRTVLPTGVKVENNLFAKSQTTSSTYNGPTVDGEAASISTYAGNMASGVTIGAGAAGTSAVSVPMAYDLYGILRPQAGSAVLDAAVNSLMDLDLDGQDRDGSPDVGADELVEGPGLNIGGPLLPVEIGPAWRENVDTTPPWVGPALKPGAKVTSSWLGDFFIGGSHWIFHPFQGWLYEGQISSTASMWFYSDALQAWAWTSRAYYPYFYDASRSAWIYYVTGEGGTYLYNYATAEWVWIP